MLRVPEEPELFAAGLPVMGLPEAGTLGRPAAGLIAVELPAVELPEAVVAGAADVGDPPEARSCCDPAPAAVAVGCSAVAGGRTSVEVDLAVCVGF